ncbi:MAG: CheY-like chemotaxis protein [Verrucomicrobiales bacterium]|jgi:CheY-like chemotaxis protein
MQWSIQIRVKWQRVTDTSSIDLGYWIDSDVPTWVLGDKPRCQQLLMNLVGNALKFTQEGHVFVTVEIFKGQRTDVEIPPDALGIHISVEDTGIGINEKAIASIFDPFEQADVSTTREFGGTGLGLSICKRIVEASGGAIWVESEIGCGATFNIVLPMQKAPGPDNSDQLLENSDGFSGKKILLLQSSHRLREAAEKHFDSLGLEVYDQADVRSNRPLLPDVGVLYGHPSDQKFQKEIATIRQRFEKLPILLVLKAEVDNLKTMIPEADSCDVLVQPCTYREVDRKVRRLSGGGGDTDTDDELDSVADSEETAALFAKMHPQKILVAEDVKVNQILSQAFLRQLGYDVAFASDGVECLEKLQIDDYSLVLMDMRMPRMDGHSAALAIRAGEAGESNKNIPIAALTANVLPQDRERCSEVGMTDFLSKPLVEEELKRVLASAHR